MWLVLAKLRRSRMVGSWWDNSLSWLQNLVVLQNFRSRKFEMWVSCAYFQRFQLWISTLVRPSLTSSTCPTLCMSGYSSYPLVSGLAVLNDLESHPRFDLTASHCPVVLFPTTLFRYLSPVVILPKGQPSFHSSSFFWISSILCHTINDTGSWVYLAFNGLHHWWKGRSGLCIMLQLPVKVQGVAIRIDSTVQIFLFSFDSDMVPLKHESLSL